MDLASPPAPLRWRGVTPCRNLPAVWRQPLLAKASELLLFEGFLVRNGQFLAAFFSAVGKHPAAVGRGHTLTETVFVLSFSVRRLECTFHDTFLKRAAKMLMFLEKSMPDSDLWIW